MLAIAATPAMAQQAGAQGERPLTAEEALSNAQDVWITNAKDEPDPCAVENPDPDVIVVCRESEDPERYMFERQTRADSEVTGSGAPRAQDPGGLLQPCEAYTFCSGGIGSVPDPAIMVDFELFPETPEGSEAARLYGGPTDAEAAAARENRVGVETQPEAPPPPPDRSDLGLETQRGIDDDVYGP
ncbi:hypothetical protein [Alteraurantiacibacter aquimixticola]|uniref:Uncharacterized protein n=1 Tax=Alteraurantiacibacter aquimixticola TaxID=2489173 RepID=A0A4T3EZE3_9SPHN|nr:hypothetical protein [Alteraurantiacibacter aquimixticola]TIX49249.1 hypothetical protein E5222_16220 [Alteraurantiacibacter aquimixticola]